MQKQKIRSVMGKFHGPASALLTFFSLGFGWLVFSPGFGQRMKHSLPSNSHAQSGSIATAIPPRQCIIFGCWVAGRQVPSHLGVPVIGLFWVTFDRLSETRILCGIFFIFYFILFTK